MIKNVTPKIEKLRGVHALACNCDCEMTLVNGITGEEIAIDGASLSAGLRAGLITAAALFEKGAKDASAHDLLISALQVAGEIYLEDMLSRKDEGASHDSE